MRDIQNKHAKDGERKLGRKHFHYRTCPDELNDKLTGYPHNGVTPFLFEKSDNEVEQLSTIVISHIIDKGPETLSEDETWTRAFWLGGGNKDVKLSKYFFRQSSGFNAL